MENIYIVFGPLVAAAILVATLLLGAVFRPDGVAALLELAGDARRRAIVHPYALTAAMVSLGGLLVTLFYCIEALRGERRDRSILFWKSLPVSDATTVLSKAIVALVVLPALALLVALCAHAARLLFATLALVVTGHSPAALWRELSVEMPLVHLLGVATLALQLAPLYGYLLLVSAWARRWAPLWALLPPYAVMTAERLVSGTSHVRDGFRDLLIGSFTRSFSLDFEGTHPMPLVDRVSQIDFARIFGPPHIWIGLGFTAACLAVAIRLRREREPLEG
jgi:ABC-2 type transport system permease protein